MTCQEVTFLIFSSLKISRIISKEVLVLVCILSKEINIIIFKIPCIYFKAGSSRHFILVKDLEACSIHILCWSLRGECQERNKIQSRTTWPHVL